MKKQKSKRRRVAIATAVVAVILVGIGAILIHARGTAVTHNVVTTGTDRDLRSVPVVLTPVSMRQFEERLFVQGNVQAETLATVAARIDGTIEHMYVDEGDYVQAGTTRLFDVDATNLQKAVEMRRQELAVARCARQEKEAYLERMAIDLHKAAIDHERYRRLYSGSAVSADVVEQYESRHKGAQAMHKHAKSLVDLATEQERQAEVAVAMAEKDLSDAVVYAPIDGYVSRRFHETGEQASKGGPMLRIEDTSTIEISAYLPVQYYQRVSPGRTPLRVSVYGTDLGGGTLVSYKSPTVDPTLRTFEIKCVVDDPPDSVVPGAIAEVEVVLTQRTGLGVPVAAVQNRGGREVVFTVEDNAARMVDVTTGIESDGWIEIESALVREGTPIVTMGQSLVDDGTPVVVHQEDA